MRKFWGFYQNDSYSVGCNGGTVYIYDVNGKELAKFKDFSYAYKAVFMPNTNIIAVKSTIGYLGFYDLEKLLLVKKITVTTIGAQDEGFAFSIDGKYFYNIEKPNESIHTQLGIYETTSFTKVSTLFEDNKKMVLEHLECDDETGDVYVLGFMRDERGVFDYGFVAKYNQEKQVIDNICTIDKDYEYLKAYKKWEMMGFTDKSLEWNSTLNKLEKIKKTSIKEMYNKL